MVPKEVAVVVVMVVVIAKGDFLLQCLFGAGASSMSDLLMVHVVLKWCTTRISYRLFLIPVGEVMVILVTDTDQQRFIPV